MIRHDDVRTHPRINFINDFRESQCDQRLSAHPSWIKSNVELWLARSEVCVNRVKDRIRVFEQNELSNACRYHVRDEAALAVIDIVHDIFSTDLTFVIPSRVTTA